MRTLLLIIYYGFAYYLPKSTIPVIGVISRALRGFLCSKLFAKTGKKMNIENRVYFGNGKDISVGHNSGLGKNLCIHCVSLTIGDYVMMADVILIQGVVHLFYRFDISIGFQGEC